MRFMLPLFLILGFSLPTFAASHEEVDNATTELLKAAEAGDLDEVIRLVTGGVNPNILNEVSNWSPLHFAAENGHPAAVATLLAHGADSAALTCDDMTALDLAASNGHQQVTQILAEHAVLNPLPPLHAQTALHHAAASNHCHIIMLLVVQLALMNVNAINAGGESPLHWATANGQTQATTLLLTLGANPHTLNNNEQNPLSLAPADRRTEFAAIFQNSLNLLPHVLTYIQTVMLCIIWRLPMSPYSQ